MKIGKFEISVSLLVHIGIVVGLAWFAYSFYFGGRPLRTEGRLGPKIQQCLNQGGQDRWEQGVSHCRSVISASPNCVDARLYLGVFLYKLGKYKDAVKAFERAAKHAKATDGQAGIALSGAGASTFAQYEPARREQAIDAAAKHYEKAMKRDPDCSEAVVGKAVLGLLRKKQKLTEASVLFAEVRDGKRPPGLAGSRSLYNGHGVALSGEGDTRAGEDAFTAGMAIEPVGRSAQQNRQWAALASFSRPGMSLKQREAMIEDYRKRTSIFGKDEGRALNALAVGLWRTRKDRKLDDYVAKAYPEAVKLLQTAIRRFSREHLSYYNLAGLYDDRVFGDKRIDDDAGLWAKLPPGLRKKGYAAFVRRNPWTGAGEKPLTEEELKVIADIHALSLQKARVLSNLLSKVKKEIKSEEEWIIQRHRFSSLDTQFAMSTSKQSRQTALSAMEKCLKRMKAVGPKRSETWKAAGRVLYYKQAHGGLVNALLKARELGDESKDVISILSNVVSKPTFFDLRPKKNRWFGVLPLVSATIHPRGLRGPVKGSLTYDGKKLNTRLAGTQVLMVAKPGFLTDGIHKIEAQATDVMGNEAKASFSLILDKRPPDLKVDPDKRVKGPRPKWKVSLTDSGTGLNLKSISVVLKSVSPSATPIHEQLIEKGRHRLEQPGANIKVGDMLTSGEFPLTIDRDLKPGVYGLRFTFSDNIGNSRTLNKNFILEKP